MNIIIIFYYSDAFLSLPLSRIRHDDAGTMVISLTNPLQNADFEVLVKGNVSTSWGQADYYVQEKLTPAKRG